MYLKRAYFQTALYNGVLNYRLHPPPPKFHSEFTPENWWLEADPFLLGPGSFSGANPLKTFPDSGAGISDPLKTMK